MGECVCVCVSVCVCVCERDTLCVCMRWHDVRMCLLSAVLGRVYIVYTYMNISRVCVCVSLCVGVKIDTIVMGYMRAFDLLSLLSFIHSCVSHSVSL